MSAAGAATVPGTEDAPAPIEGDETETPVEVPAPAEPEAPAEEAAPVEETPEQAAAKAEAAKTAEAELQKAAEKFANKTMAAARRAEARATASEARIETVKTENTALKKSVEVYEGFVGQFKTDPIGAIKRIGFSSVKSFLEHCTNAGETAEPSPADEVKALREERRLEKEAAAKAAAEAKITEAKGNVRKAIEADKVRWTRTATSTGQGRLWAAIEAYNEMHGDVPDEAVHLMADVVEKELREEFGEPIPVQRQDATKPGAPAASAANAGRTAATKTLGNKQTSGAPAVREYSLDPEERRRQVSEDMRAAGEL